MAFLPPAYDLLCSLGLSIWHFWGLPGNLEDHRRLQHFSPFLRVGCWSPSEVRRLLLMATAPEPLPCPFPCLPPTWQGLMAFSYPKLYQKSRLTSVRISVSLDNHSTPSPGTVVPSLLTGALVPGKGRCCWSPSQELMLLRVSRGARVGGRWLEEKVGHHMNVCWGKRERSNRRQSGVS